MKGEGFPPEKALVTVKALVKDAISPHIAHYDGAALTHDRTAPVADASQWCIDAYFNEAPERRLREGATSGGNTVARKSLSRRLLLKLLLLQPPHSSATLANRLSVNIRQLASFAAGTQLMPLDVQERLAHLVTEHEPHLARLARRLRLQIEAARRYHEGQVIGHMTSPPKMW